MRDAFDDAVISGDLSAIQATFAQRHVRDNIEEANALVVETQPTNPEVLRLRGSALPWFRQARYSGDTPLRSAARRGHVHVIEWFFSRERAAIMGATLALILPLVAEFSDSRQWHEKERKSDVVVMETLLSSYVFCEVDLAHDKQAILDRIVGHCRTPSVLQLAISHGARINEALTPIALCCENDFVEMLEDDGALFVGADVVKHSLWGYRRVAAFMKRGIDLRGCEELLLQAADQADEERVETLLSTGFPDVDARDDNGMTALMHLNNDATRTRTATR